MGKGRWEENKEGRKGGRKIKREIGEDNEGRVEEIVREKKIMKGRERGRKIM